MRNLIKLTEEYLSRSTDFAIQIVGSWGHGKTFYYRNTLESIIYKKLTHNDASKNYKPIYVSIFGLKSIEDIATKIVMEFFQSKNFKDYYKSKSTRKKLRITQSVFKIGLRGFLNFSMLGNFNEYLTDIKNIGENALDTNELVICFDDLERKDSLLNMEDLTGYINSLVDEGIKIIIISNEDLLLKNDPKYKNLKEKIIGITIEFVPDTIETLKSIITSKYSSSNVYLKFLQSNIDMLINLVNASNNNFRHIIYALDCLHHCYSKMKYEIFDTKHEIKDRLEQEIIKISIMILALSIEYKSSLLKYSDLHEYNDLSLKYIFSHATNNKYKETEKSKVDHFLLKYNIRFENYLIFKSIFSYVTAYDEFNITSFVSEFKSIFHLEKGDVLPQYQLFEDLSYDNYFNLTDDEYKKKTLALIEYASKGLYTATFYLSIMYYAERFDNFLNLDLNETKEKLIKGLRTSIQSTSSDNQGFTEFEMSGRSDHLSAFNMELYIAGMEEIKLLKEQRAKGKIEKVVKFLTDDPIEFQKQYKNDQNSFRFELNKIPIFKSISPDSLLELIKHANPKTILFLADFFKDRYEFDQNRKDEFDDLFHFTTLIKEFCDSELQKEGNKIRFYLINQLLTSLIKLGDKVNKASSVM